MKLPVALFHYTVGPKLPLILESRQLLPAGFGMAVSVREKPVLWWSSNPHWEPTATKVISVDGGKSYFRPSVDELQKAAGIYRFRLDTRNPEALHALGIKLVPWTRMPLVARIDAKETQSMVAAGLKLGATPTHWWGTLEPVPTALEVSGVLRVECCDAEGLKRNNWVQVEGGLPAAVAAFEEMAKLRKMRITQARASDTPAAIGI